MTHSIANKFNNYFINVGSTLANNIPTTDTDPIWYLRNNYINSFYFSPVVEQDIVGILKSLKNSSPGWDQIHPKVLKFVSDEIAPPLTYIINLSLISGVFPSSLKLAQVTSIYKKVIVNYSITTDPSQCCQPCQRFLKRWYTNS